MATLQHLLEQAQRLEYILGEQLIEQFGSERPVTTDAYLRSCVHHDTRAYSNEIPKSQARLASKISSEYSPAAAGIYNQLALVQLSIERLRSEEFVMLPEPIQKLTSAWFEQIYADIAARDVESYDLDQLQDNILDDLKRDFAVCSGRALPVGGAWVVERRKLVGEKLVASSPGSSDKTIRSKRRTLYRALKKIANRAGLLEPLISFRNHWYQLTGRYADYLVIHTAGRYRRYFSEKYLNEAYKNIALLLLQDNALMGLYRSSWFLDPAVIEMEPKLAFLSRTPVENGALYGPREALEGESLGNALKHSQKRKAAYDRGDYIPWSWAYVWYRKDMLDWAMRN